MESVIERIERGHFWKFHGGIHPPEQKFLTADKPIRSLSIPNELIIPLQQHIGQAADLLVSIGDTVLKGQALTASHHPMAVPIHAPTSGTITAIKNSVIAHPSGLSEPCIFITPDGLDTWAPRKICTDYQSLSNKEILEKIANAGISGMGGAGFPTHIKVSTQAKINFLIINAAECEPYITADDLLIREHSTAIIDGVNILDKLLTPQTILIGIEDNKPQAIQALKSAALINDKIKVCVLPTKYPTGGEKQLIQILTGKEVPSGVLPSSLGIVMQNTATCFAIADSVINDTPLLKRVVTVSGQALKKPQNVWALLGTPVSYLLEQCGYSNKDKKHIIMGGPMMGYSLPSDRVPVVKTTNCLLAPSEKEISSEDKEVECIRCGQCADVCPSQLLPQELQWSAKAKDQVQLETLNLFDCIECGACAYVCPSQIPLVHYYRVAKSEIRQQKQLDIKAEKAKVRFEARKLRLERDKKAREEKHKKAAEARKARMNSGSVEGKTEQSAVAAALARVKAKKAFDAKSNDTSTNSATNGNSSDENVNESLVDEQKSQVALAIARAKAKKLAAKKAATTNTELPQTTETAGSTSPENPQEKSPEDIKKARIAAAVAKAKAKKSELPQTAESTSPADTEEKSPDDIKKARVAAAVAKAKAKKAASKKTEQPQEIDVPELTENTAANKTEEKSPDDIKKARVAAAVAKAKAKKAASKKTEQPQEIDAPELTENTVANKTEEQSPEDVKKARIAAAVAKAKAKKLAEKAAKNSEVE